MEEKPDKESTRNFPRRMSTIETALGWDDFHQHLKNFMGVNNFTINEQLVIIHALNSFYFMSVDIKKLAEAQSNGREIR